MPNFKAGDNAPVEAWLFSQENTEAFPAHFGTIADHPAGTGKADVIGPDGMRTTIAPDTYVVLGPNGALSYMQKRSFQRIYQETDEEPPESLRAEFERRVLKHPGEVSTGSEGKARQGAKFVGGEAGRDTASEGRSDAMGNQADPSGSVPGAPVGPNTGGSPHELAAQAAQPELVARGTDAKVEAPDRPAAERGVGAPGSGPGGPNEQANRLVDATEGDPVSGVRKGEDAPQTEAAKQGRGDKPPTEKAPQEAAEAKQSKAEQSKAEQKLSPRR